MKYFLYFVLIYIVIGFILSVTKYSNSNKTTALLGAGVVIVAWPLYLVKK